MAGPGRSTTRCRGPRASLTAREHETLNEKEIAAVFAPIEKRPPRPVWRSSADRPVSDLPPVRTEAEIAAGEEEKDPVDQAAEAGEPLPPLTGDHTPTLSDAVEPPSPGERDRQ